MMLALYCSMNDFTLSTDLNPSTFAGASDELDWLAAPDAVAELGIGKAGGVTKSPSTTERLFGVPSWKGKDQLHVQYPNDRTAYLCCCVYLDSTTHPADPHSEHHGTLLVSILKLVGVFSSEIPSLCQLPLDRSRLFLMVDCCRCI